MSINTDLSSISTGQRLDTITKAFNDLELEAELTISSKDNFFPLVADFQKQYWGKYSWAPISTGPEIWKGKIMKRKEGESAPRGIAEFMSFDHSRCDKLYADGEAAGIEGNWDKATELLNAFVLGMYRHFSIEETVFFPAFEKETGMTEGPTQMMRTEHEQMKGSLEQMREAINKGDHDTILGIGETLLIMMQQHNMKEEQMLYPMADMHLSRTEDLLKKMELVE